MLLDTYQYFGSILRFKNFTIFKTQVQIVMNVLNYHVVTMDFAQKLLNVNVKRDGKELAVTAVTSILKS